MKNNRKVTARTDLELRSAIRGSMGTRMKRIKRIYADFFLRKSGYSTALRVKYDLFMWFDDLKRRFYEIRVSGQN
jgi:hypothetical protein